MKENGEGRQRNASNEASFSSLFNIELMLSCVMKSSQTLRYSTRGSRRVSGGVGLCESTHTMPLSVWTASPAMVRYSLTYPRHHPLYHQICSRATETGRPGPLHISFFKLASVSSEKKARLVTLWSNLPFLLWHTKNEHYPPVLGTENHMQCTCTLTWTHMSQALVI